MSYIKATSCSTKVHCKHVLNHQPKSNKLLSFNITISLLLLHPNTNITFRPHKPTIRPNACIPLRKIRQRNIIPLRNNITRLILLHKVEFLAIPHHTRLRWRRRLNPIRRLRRRRRRRRRRVSNNRNTGIRFSPEATTIRTRSRIPGIKLCQRDPVCRRNSRTRIPGLHEVKLVAVAD